MAFLLPMCVQHTRQPPPETQATADHCHAKLERCKIPHYGNMQEAQRRACAVSLTLPLPTYFPAKSFVTKMPHNDPAYCALMSEVFKCKNGIHGYQVNATGSHNHLTSSRVRPSTRRSMRRSPRLHSTTPLCCVRCPSKQIGHGTRPDKLASSACNSTCMPIHCHVSASFIAQVDPCRTCNYLQTSSLCRTIGNCNRKRSQAV